MLGVIPVTAAGRVRTDADVAVSPVPNELVDTTVNVYSVPPLRPVNVYVGTLVVCVVVAGVVVMVYPVAPYAGVHAKSTVVTC